jgi:methylated-DNA-[protein]-cysteine S-methyltransferase
MNKERLQHYVRKFPVGNLKFTSNGKQLTEISFVIESENGTKDIIIEQAIKQIDEYFAGIRKDFDIPLKLTGTEFQNKTWKALQNIPFGGTKSYSELAAMMGNPKAVRAVGGANNKNPFPIIIPCHRVIGADGSLTGYAGGIEVKKYLLELERKNLA